MLTKFGKQAAVCAILLSVAQLNGCSVTKNATAQDGTQNLASANAVTVNDTTAGKSNGKGSSYTIKGKRYYVLNDAKGYHKQGMASWYGKKFHGKKTSSSEKFNLYGMTAASPVLPLHSYIKVTNLQNGKQVVVKVNDRGPFKYDRILDVSYGAAKKLGFAGSGLAMVDIEAIDNASSLLTQSTTATTASTKTAKHSHSTTKKHKTKKVAKKAYAQNSSKKNQQRT